MTARSGMCSGWQTEQSDSLSRAKPIVLEDRIWWQLEGMDGHDIRFVVNWGSNRIYVWDQTGQTTLLDK